MPPPPSGSTGDPPVEPRQRRVRGRPTREPRRRRGSFLHRGRVVAGTAGIARSGLFRLRRGEEQGQALPERHDTHGGVPARSGGGGRTCCRAVVTGLAGRRGVEVRDGNSCGFIVSVRAAGRPPFPEDADARSGPGSRWLCETNDPLTGPPRRGSGLLDRGWSRLHPRAGVPVKSPTARRRFGARSILRSRQGHRVSRSWRRIRMRSGRGSDRKQSDTPTGRLGARLRVSAVPHGHAGPNPRGPVSAERPGKRPEAAAVPRRSLVQHDGCARTCRLRRVRRVRRVRGDRRQQAAAAQGDRRSDPERGLTHDRGAATQAATAAVPARPSSPREPRGRWAARPRRDARRRGRSSYGSAVTAATVRAGRR